MKLRTGRKVGRTLYEQRGPHPSDSDPLIGLMDTPELAQQVVTAVNAMARIRELHAPVTEQVQIRIRTFCSHCRAEGDYGYSEPAEWPCPTIRALEDQ